MLLHVATRLVLVQTWLVKHWLDRDVHLGARRNFGPKLSVQSLQGLVRPSVGLDLGFERRDILCYVFSASHRIIYIGPPQV